MARKDAACPAEGDVFPFNSRSFSAAALRDLTNPHWPRRLLALATAFLHLLVFVIAPAQAAPILDPLAPINSTPRLETTARGVPVLHIAPPDAGGLSHNRLQQLDIDALGLIFNNSTRGGTTLLGGQIGPNTQLGGTPARTILTEITGPLPSRLAGPLEIFGTPAWAIIANPNGITCNGCGILNAPRLTLAAARIDWTDPSAGLDTTRRFKLLIEDGRIDIGQGGIESTRAALELIGGAIHIADPVRAGANALTLRAGPGAWQPDTGAWQPSTSTDTPTYRVDATAFGAISAGQIDILVSGQGAGVRTAADLAARAADLTLSADGDIRLATTYAKNDATITSHNGQLHLTGGTTASGNLTLDAAGNLHGDGPIEAARTLTAASRTGNLTLTGPTLAEGGLTLDAAHNLTTLGPLTAGGELQISAGYNAALTGPTSSGGDTRARALTGELQLKGPLTTGGATRLSAGTTLTTTAPIQSQRDATLTAPTLNILAPIASGGQLELTGTHLTIGADLAAANGTRLNADNLTFAAPGGALAIGGDLSLTLANALNLTTALTIGGNAHLQTGGAAHFAAPLATGGNLQLQSGGDILLAHPLTVGGNATLTGDGITLTDARIAGTATLEAGAGALTTGALLTGGALTATAGGDIHIGGPLATGGATTLTTGGALTLGADALLLGDATLTAAGATQLAGQLATAGRLTLTTESLTTASNLLATGPLSVAAGAGPIHIGGALASGSTLNLTSGADITLAGPASAGGDTTLSAANNLTLNGNALLRGPATLTAGTTLTTAADLTAAGPLTLAAADIALTGAGSIAATGDIHANAAHNLALDTGGRLYTLGAIGIDATTLTNAGAIAAAQSLTAHTTTATNTGQLAAGTTQTHTGNLTNTGVIHAPQLALTGGGTNSGQIGADTLTLGGAYWSNTGALSASALGIDAALNNSGTLGANTLNINGPSLSNNGLISASTLDIHLSGNLDNHGTLTASNLVIGALGNLTNGGAIQSAGSLAITLGGALSNTLAETASCPLTSGCATPDDYTYTQQSGQILAGTSATIQAGTLTNAGTIQTANNLDLNITGTLANQQSPHDAYATGSGTGKILAGGQITASAATLTNTGTLQGSRLQLTAGALTNDGQLHASAGSLTATVGAGGATLGAGSLTAAASTLTLTSAGNLTNDGHIAADGPLTLTAADIANTGNIDGYTQAYGPAQTTLTASGSLTNNGRILGDSALTATGGSIGGTGLFGTRGTLHLAGPGDPTALQLIADGLLILDTGPITIDVGQSWSNAAAQIQLGGLLTNYGSINLAGHVIGNIDNLASFGPVAGEPPPEYHAVCPATLTDCSAIAHERITARAVASIGSLSGTLRNDSSYATTGGIGGYDPHSTTLLVLWEGKNAGGETVQITTEHLDPVGPQLYVTGPATIELLAPNTGVIVGDDLTLTGTDLINAPAADLAAANAALTAANATAAPTGAAPTVTGDPLGGWTGPDPSAAGAANNPLANLADPATPSARRPDLLLAAARSGTRPPDNLPTNPTPDWADLNLPAGTIHAQNLKLDFSGHLLNFGAITASETALIHADKTLTNLGKIDSDGLLLLASAELTNHGGMNAGTLFIEGKDLVNTGQIHAQDFLALNLSGDLTHKTDGATRADMTSGGDLILAVGGNATIHNADVEAGNNLIADIKGNLDVTAQTTTTETTNFTQTGKRQLTRTTQTDTTVETSTLKAGGTMYIETGGDLTLEAAKVKAGGDLGLVAGKDLKLKAVAEKHETATATTDKKGRPDGDTTSTSANLTHHTTELEAGGNLLLQAGNDLTAQGGSAKAGKNLAITAGGNATFDAVLDTQGSSTRHTSAGYVSGDDSATWTTTHRDSLTQSSTARGFQAEAGGNLGVRAEGDLTATAAHFTAGADLALSAGNNLALRAAAEGSLTGSSTTTQHTDPTTGQPVVTASASRTELNTRGSGSTLSAGGNLTLQSGADMHLTDVTASGKNLGIDAGGNLTIDGAANTTSVTATRDGKGMLGGTTQTTTTDTTQTYQGSHLSANGKRADGDGQLVIHTGGDMTLTGSTLAANGNGKLDIGGSLTVNAAQNLHTQQNTERGANLDGFAYNPPGAASGSLTHSASGIDAGGDLTIHTGGDFNTTASRFSAGNNLAIRAEGSFNAASLTDQQASQNGYSSDNRSTLAPTSFTAGNNLDLQSGGDMRLTGVHNKAGGKITVETGGNLTLNTVATGSETVNGKNREQHQRAEATTFEAGGDIRVKAAGDITATGVKASSQEGDVKFKAGGKLDLLAATETDSTTLVKKNSGTFSSSRITTTDSTTTARGVELSSGEHGKVELEAGQDITLESAAIHAGTGGTRVASADGDVHLTSAQESHTIRRLREDDWAVSEHTHDSGTSTTAPGRATTFDGGPVEFDTPNGTVQTHEGETKQRNWDDEHRGLTTFGTALVIVASYGASTWASGFIGDASGAAAGSGATFAAGLPATAEAAAVMPGFGNAVLSGGFGAAAGSTAAQVMTGDGIDFGQVMRAAFSGAVGAGVGAYFGTEYSAARVAASAAGGCAGAAATGGECGKGALIAGATTSLAWAADEMHQQMVEQSKQFKGVYQIIGTNPDGSPIESDTYNNISGPRWGGRISLGGERTDLPAICTEGASCTVMPDGRVLFERKGETGPNLDKVIESVNSSSKLGAYQGGPGAAFGVSYEPGSTMDRLVEAFGGSHDFGNNLVGGYETVNDPANLRFIGNAARIVKGSAQYYFVETMNYFNLLPASPFVAAEGITSHNLNWMTYTNPQREERK